MKPHVTVALLAIASLQIGMAQQARQPSPQAKGESSKPPVEVRTWVSRTAVWVGDRVAYVVELRCPPDVEVLTDDLDAERLRLSGLEILDTAAERDASVTDLVTYRMRYTLVSYATDASELSIAALPVRYSVRRPGQAAGELLPAGEVVVPELKLALRSTIPINDPSLGLRDQRELEPLPLRLRVAPRVGVVLVALAIAPVVFWAADLGRRAYQARARRRSRPSPRQHRAVLEEIKGLDVSSVDSRRDAFARLDALMRAHLDLKTGVAAAALTSSELAGLTARGPRGIPAEQVERVLAECERAKYAPEPPGADRWRTVLHEADEIITA